VAALATLEDIPESPQIAELAAERVPRMLNAFGRDGGWPEGAIYWVGTPLLVQYLDVLYTATAGEHDFLGDPRLRRTCWFPLYCAVSPCGTVPFGDGYYDRGDTYPVAFAALAARHHDEQLQWGVLQNVLRAERRRPFPGIDWAGLAIFFDPSLPTVSPDRHAPLAAHFRDVGYTVIRNGWGEDEKPLVACLTPRAKDGVCLHFDAGNVFAAAFGQPFIADYGYGNGTPEWTWRHRPNANGMWSGADPVYSTAGHNVVDLSGRNQPRQSAVTVTDFQNDDRIGALVRMDVTSAYSGALRAERMVLHLRPAILVVLDEFDLQNPEEAWLSWHLPPIQLPGDAAENADISPYLTTVDEEGRFRLAAQRGGMTAVCRSLVKSPATCSADAHRRIGMCDHFGIAMPNTIYPYVRTADPAASRHVFLSAFAFLPNEQHAAAEWQTHDAGFTLLVGSKPVAAVAYAGAKPAGFSSDARLAVADLADRRAVLCEGTFLATPDGTKHGAEANAFVTW